MQRHNLLAYAGVLCTISLAACSLVNSLDNYQRVASDVPDARSMLDAASPALDAPAIDAAQSCNSSDLPVRPGPSAEGANIEFVSAVSKFEFPPRGAGGIGFRGLNLDGLCTCPGKSACTAARGDGLAACDESGGSGIDNGLMRFLDETNALLQGGAATFDPNARVAAGSETIFFRVTNWNGQPNDDAVTLHLFASLNLLKSSRVNPLLPAFDGADEWSVDSRTVKPGALPYAALEPDLRAYVSGGVLVSRVNYDVRLGQFVLPIGNGRVVAKIEASGNSYRLTNGMLAGRSRTSAFLTNLQVGKVPSTTIPLCRGNGIYDVVKGLFCKRSDIMADPGSDGVAGAVCDSVSFGVGFETVPARTGALAERPAPITPCGADYADDCNIK